MDREAATDTSGGSAISFAKLLAPFDREQFLAEVYGLTHLHVSGPSNRFETLFGWRQLDELLAQTPLWDNRSLAMSLDGRTLPPERYCHWSTDRLGDRVRRPDPTQVATLLQHGATLVVDFIDRMVPAIRALAECLEAVLLAPVTASAFVSWQRRQGYPVHFDTQQVFALQIAGRKAWRLYQGRFADPAELKGFRTTDLTAEQKQALMGGVEARIELQPGDLLHVPAGQFHEALALDEASLHLSFGVMHPTAQDFLQTLLEALPQDPNFRRHLPHPDKIGAQDFLAALADRLGGIVRAPATLQQLQQFQRAKAFDRWGGLQVHDRRLLRRFRVRWRQAQLAGDCLTLPRRAPLHLSRAAARLAEWALPRDLASETEIVALLGAEAPAAVGELVAAGLLEPT